MRTIARIIDLIAEVKLDVRRQSVILNRVPPALDPLVVSEMERLKIRPLAMIPEDEEVYQYDLKLKPLLELPDSSRAVMAVNSLMDGVLSTATKSPARAGSGIK